MNENPSSRWIPSIHILVHGVNSDGAWYKDFTAAATASMPSPVIIPFTWGEYTTRKNGGSLIRAVDEVHQMFDQPLLGYDRLYQGHAAIRLKELIDACNQLSCQVNVIAHSNGTVLAIGALLLGAALDFLLMMGSPLDCDNERSQKELSEASHHVRSHIYNLWNPHDAWASMKGGIGAYGDNPTYIARNPQIINIPFVHGFSLHGHRIGSNFPPASTRGRAELHHTDYYHASNVPVLMGFVQSWQKQAGDAKPLAVGDLERLFKQADWSQTTHYQQKKNVTLQEELFAKYRPHIQRILDGLPAL